MKKVITVIILAILSNIVIANDALEVNFIAVAKQFNGLNLETLPIKDHGRLKPLDTFARETNLFITGKKSLLGLNPVEFFMALNIYKDAEQLRIINVREPELRKALGLDSNERLFSLKQLEQTSLMSDLQTALEVEKKNKKLLTPIQTAQIEVSNQMWMLKSIMTNDLLVEGLKYQVNDPDSILLTPLQNLFISVSSNQSTETIHRWADELLSTSAKSNIEESFKNQRDRISLEVLYNKLNLFFWAGILYFLISFTSFLPFSNKFLSDRSLSAIVLVPLVMLLVGFGTRIYITEFPPVTNMYGTMIWVSFGISLFSYILYILYKDRRILGMMTLGSSLLLLLTESIPLIISPSMDPIVAVLRSSYWLTIHVLTVTISYAAFSMAMIIGNLYMIKSIFNSIDEEWIDRFSKYAYRSIQLGVFLLTSGIILGGVWADYSWGRFWGWDPKETWALIADLGFLAILHGRFTGWTSQEKLLKYTPLAYLLVIMAWFGVNFVLAAGLHSYGFSSGGTFMVIAFIATQLALYAIYLSKLVFNAKK